MEEVTIEKLIDKIKEYNEEEENIILKAYEFAKLAHINQQRESGEPYIIHPLNVAYILSEMHADRDTICASLLHDTLEDTNVTKEEIEKEFGKEVANLVLGVTKIRKLDYEKYKIEAEYTRKIITSLKDDIRIIIIKLADRLHNMRTLEYKKKDKQLENATETLEIFAPLAYYIGAYRIKSELEDLSLKYIDNFEYNKILEEKDKIDREINEYILDMTYKIRSLLENKEIPNQIKTRAKNIYGIYKRLKENKSIYNIHDLIALKIMVDTIDNCYLTLGLVHSQYKPVNEKFKDYIANPKTNLYSSLHTTVFGPNERLVQTQIRTFDMDKVASFGLPAHWDKEKGNARLIMQKAYEKLQISKSLAEIDEIFSDKENDKFLTHVKSELFSDRVYVFTPTGETIELPKGSTIVDFAYKIHTDLGNMMVGAKVNGKDVSLDYPLTSKDIVYVLTNENSPGPQEDWVAKTAYALKEMKKGRELKKIK